MWYMNPKSGSLIFLQCCFNFLIKVLIANLAAGKHRMIALGYPAWPNSISRGTLVRK